MTTDFLMTTTDSKEKITPILQHEVDIFNPVQDPVKRQLMLRATESLSAMSDAVFKSPKSAAPMKLRDNAIPIVSDVKIVDPEIRNMTAAAAFEQLDIEANLTEEERIRKALDEYALMMGAADKLIAESRQKSADADQQRDFMRVKADAKIEEAKKRAETLEAKKREIEMLMEANELEMKARKMKQEAQKMKEEAERKKEVERLRMEEAALRELEDIQEEKEEEVEEDEEETGEVEVVRVEIVEVGRTPGDVAMDDPVAEERMDEEQKELKANEVVFVPANEELPIVEEVLATAKAEIEESTG